MGQKAHFTMRPFLLLIVNKKHLGDLVEGMKK